MRRSFLVAKGGLALAAAMAAGPFGAAAAAPYVYGCTPVTLVGVTSETVELNIYNGSASTATVVRKVLAGNGTNLLIFSSPTSIPATHTSTIDLGTGGSQSEGSSTVASAVRIVSDVPVAASITHHTTSTDWFVFDCIPLQP
jgi:hypothetical protein